MSTPHFNSLPRSFRLHHHRPFAADPTEPIPLRKSSLSTTVAKLTVPTQLPFANTRATSPSVSSQSSDDTFVGRDPPASSGSRHSSKLTHDVVDLASYYLDDNNTGQSTACISALPDLPPDLDALSRDALERLTRLLFADSCRVRWVAMSEQEKSKDLERKLDKLSSESIRRQAQLLEAAEKQGRELAIVKEEAAGLRQRLGQVLSILSSMIPGLVPKKASPCQ